MARPKEEFRVKRTVHGNKFNEVFDSQKDMDTFNELLDQLAEGRLGSNDRVINISLAKAWCNGANYNS